MQIDFDELIRAASEAKELAYAPYSSFRVGAALLSDSGEIITGCNVENAAYGLSICAERTALVKAVSSGIKKFRGLAVVTDAAPPAMPCGQCLQSLAEFCQDLVVVAANGSGERTQVRLTDLLPYRFNSEALGE